MLKGLSVEEAREKNIAFDGLQRGYLDRYPSKHFIEKLRVLEELGVSKVETFIASGNVIFDAKAKKVKVLEKKTEPVCVKRWY
jgi:hypothetical protein